jgi:hypothetical protein
MRYTDAITWEDFKPVLAGQNGSQTETLVSPWTTLNFNITNTPVLSGTVTINVTNGVDPDVLFTDQNRDGTLSAFPSTNSGTIDYITGAVSLTFNPPMTANADVSITYQYPLTYLFTARILIPYYGRLLALNTYEGITNVGAKNYYNRCRFSQIGSPIQDSAWLTTTFGRGGFIDAPTAEQIVSAIFFKNTLIVSFERSTWQLRYIGEQGLPFIWERISSDFGSESQFSAILFDSGVLQVGNRAITAATSQTVDRIDLKIPDLVFDFLNDNQGASRVHGIRDFYKELVFWGYNDSSFSESDQYYPNKTLLYNYRNNTFSILRNNFTCFGRYYTQNGISWNSADVYWDDADVFWDDPQAQKETTLTVMGNQEGFIHQIDYTSIEESSLTITDIDRSGDELKLIIPNHNLVSGDIIYVTDIKFLDTTTSTPVSTDLNDQCYIVKNVDFNDADFLDAIYIWKWSISLQQYVSDFSYTPTNGTGTYIGGGKVTLLPRMDIQTKDFNPFLMAGKQMKISYIDFLFDNENQPSSESSITVNTYANTNIQESGNLLTGNSQASTLPTDLFPSKSQDIVWNRFYNTVFGQFISVQITYNDDEMNNKNIQDDDFILNSMIIWGKPGGRLST